MAEPQSVGVFLCYRRGDSSGHAGRLADALAHRFGRRSAFLDVESIEPGVDFVDAFSSALERCRVVLAVIGPGWLDADLHGRRRLEDPADFVRIEILMALRNGLRVVPILVNGAAMPRAEDLPPEFATFARSNAFELRDQTWSDSSRALLDLVSEWLEPDPSPPETCYAVTRDGVNIAYRVMGTGSPEIVFIPPWTSSVELDVEDPYIGPTLRRAASLGRFLSYDKRGVGMSDTVDPGANPTLEERVDELTTVLDASGFQRPTVFTGGDGAAVAMVFAAMYPEKLHALCLYAPFARLIEASDYPIGYPPDAIDALLEFAGRTWGSGQFAATAPSHAHDQRFLEWMARYQRRSASPSAAKRFLRIAVETDVRDVLPLIRVATVVMHRRGDQLVRIEIGRYVADHIPGARFIELEGNDHFWAVGDTGSILDVVEEVANRSTNDYRERPTTCHRHVHRHRRF